MVVAYFLLGGFLIGKYYEYKSARVIQEGIDKVQEWAISTYPDMLESDFNKLFGNRSFNLTINST